MLSDRVSARVPTVTKEEAEIARRTKATLEDPVAFSRVFLNHDPWPIQEKILNSVRDNNWTSVKACHASGKTRTAADAALWWLTSKSDGIVVTTAPTWMQVEQVLWGEIRSAVETANIKYPIPSMTSLKLGEKRYAIGLSTNEGVRFQGFHGTILIILDEAPGVLPEIYEAIEGIRAGGDVHLLELGNPVIGSGPFYDSHHSKRMNRNCITISAFDTPNLQGLTLESLLEMGNKDKKKLDINVRPYLTRRNWVFEKFYEWGVSHPMWMSRVMGQFPLQSEDSLFSLDWLEKAKIRPQFGDDSDIRAGLDVAGPGENETALYLMRGRDVISFKSWSKADPRGEIVAELNKYKSQIKSVGVDGIGIGYGMYQHLKDQGFPVINVNVGVSPKDKDKFFNLKAEAYWNLRENVRLGHMSGLSDENTIAQLSSIRYKQTPQGKIMIEKKEDMVKRGVVSPDRAEALMLCDYANSLTASGNIQVFW